MNERGRRFSHLSWHNRLKIEKMLKEGYKAQEIADALHVHNSTIYREIKRGLTVQRTSELVDREVYCPDTAQRKYEESKSVHGPDLKIGNDHELAARVQCEGVTLEQDAISRIESGQRMVQDYELRALAEVLGASMDWLAGKE